MFCGYIERDYKTEIHNISKIRIEEICNGSKYFTVNMSDEYFIFIDNEIYIEENYDRIFKIVATLNKELLNINKNIDGNNEDEINDKK